MNMMNGARDRPEGASFDMVEMRMVLLMTLSVAVGGTARSEAGGRWKNITAGGSAYTVVCGPHNEGVV